MGVEPSPPKKWRESLGWRSWDMGQLSQVCACLVDGGVVAMLRKAEPGSFFDHSCEEWKPSDPWLFRNRRYCLGTVSFPPTMVAAFAMHMTPEKSTVFSSGDWRLWLWASRCFRWWGGVRFWKVHETSEKWLKSTIGGVFFFWNRTPLGFRTRHRI